MTVFTLIASDDDARCAGLMVESLRTFGGTLADAEVRAYVHPTAGDVDLPSARMMPFETPAGMPRYPFALKVATCALAERHDVESAGGGDAGRRTLVWMSPHCLVLRPPDLLSLAPPARAAFRAVHISNVGSRADEPVDRYWAAIYEATGTEPPDYAVHSLVDRVRLRPYFNTHMFAVDPDAGLLAAWEDRFGAMAADGAFQSGPCADEKRRIFLHQAVLCALLTGTLTMGETRQLPVGYSYPLHLHGDVPAGSRPAHLAELTCPVYEGTFRYPDTLGGVEVREPLASWLAERT